MSATQIFAELGMVKLRKAGSLDEAVAIADEIREFPFYSEFENVRKEHLRMLDKTTEWYVTEKGKIYYVYIGTFGERLFNEHSLHSCISAGGFNSVSIFNTSDDSIAYAEINKQSWDRSNRNRMIFAELGITLTSRSMI